MIKMTSEAKIEKIVSAAMSKMADFASHVEPGFSYTAEDIAATVMADPTSETARFLANVIAKSIELVSTLEYAEAA